MSHHVPVTDRRPILRALFLLAGVLLFALVAWQVGPRAIAAAVAQMGWSLLGVAAIYLAYQIVRATALRLCLVAGEPIALPQVIWIRLSGEAVQFLTFTGPLLAEPTKAWLLRHRGLTTRQAFAGVVAEYLLYTLLSAALSIAALLILDARYELSPALGRTARVVIAIMSAFLIVSIIAILGRIHLIGAIIEALSRTPGLRRRIRPDMTAVHEMEDLLLGVLRDRPRRLLLIVLVEVAAQGLLVAELGLVLATLHPDAPRVFAFFVEAGAKFASVAFFFIPAQLGATEGTYAVLVDALGLPAATGFALAFVRRARSLAVAAGGLAALSAIVPARSC